MVRRLVEHEQLRVRDHEARQRRTRLLATRHRGRRAGPFVTREPEAGQRLVDPLVERVPAQHVEPVLELRVRGLAGMTVPLQARELLAHLEQVGGALADRRPKVR